MKNTKRAERRRHLNRMKNKAEKIAKDIWGYKDDICKRMRKDANNLKMCNCSMCANRRQFEGVTRKEMINTVEEYD